MVTMASRTAASQEAATRYAATFPSRADQVQRARHEVTRYLAGHPAEIRDDAALIVSELASNAVNHPASVDGSFTVRCETRPGCVYIEAEDPGGPWQPRQHDDRPHGLDIVQALTGPDGWGTETTGDGNRVVWARLAW
jgi:anti-sigma regulatory factor (Ser/Thr protein kinase)